MNHTKKHVLTLLKLAISLAIITYLVRNVMQEDAQTFARLRDGDKNWPLLALALLCLFSSVLLTFVRWFWLVRALEIPFRFRDALRLGFLCYMFNLVSLGSVGGDLFKAVFLAREQPDRKTEAVATIVVDRLIGLYGLLLVGGIAMLNLDLSGFEVEFQTVRTITVAAAIGMTVGLALLMMPFSTRGPLVEKISSLPKIGPIYAKLIRSARMYQRQRDVVLGSIFVTVVVHCLNVTVFCLISTALPYEAPPLLAQFAVVPIGLLSSALPLPMGALGAFEAVMNYLYAQISLVTPPPSGQGLLVTLTFRVLTILVAAIGVVFYLRQRKEVDEMVHKAEIEEEGSAS